MSDFRAISQFTQREIDALFQASRLVFKKDGIAIRLAPRIGESSRILIIASKKAGNAVKRNKVRRRIKSIFYEEKLYELSPNDWIIFIYKNGISLSYQELKKIILSIVQKSYIQ